jgi:hypothetical protein
MAEAVDALIDAGLDHDHRLLLAHAVVGMAEGASRHFLDAIDTTDGTPGPDDGRRQARRIAELAWAGLRSVHRD